MCSSRDNASDFCAIFIITKIYKGLQETILLLIHAYTYPCSRVWNAQLPELQQRRAKLNMSVAAIWKLVLKLFTANFLHAVRAKTSLSEYVDFCSQPCKTRGLSSDQPLLSIYWDKASDTSTGLSTSSSGDGRLDCLCLLGKSSAACKEQFRQR